MPSDASDPERLLHHLRERVKELTALHGTADVLANDALSTREILARVAALLPPAFMYPEDTAGCVTYGTEVAATPGFTPTPWRLRSPFETRDGRAGAVEVVYLREHPPEAEGPFLAEERRLLDSLAEMVAAALARRRIGEYLRTIVGAGVIRLVELDIETNQLIWPALRPEDAERGRFVSMSYDDALARIHPDDREGLRKSVAAALAGSPPVSTFTTEFRADFGGGYEWRQLIAGLIRDATGKPVRVLGVSADISESRGLQDRLRQGQKMEALGRLAGSVAHDFGNVLTAILGYAQLIEMRLPGTDPVGRYAREITKSGKSATAFVRQILAFGRRQELQPAVVDVAAVVSETESMLGRLLGRGVAPRLELAPAVPAAFVDPHQLQQVLLNLAVNARDAMPGGGTLTIRVRKAVCGAPQPDGATSEAREWVALEVEDTGTGMPPEIRERIFEPFFTTKDEGKGTGLGLATVHGIVTQSGGFLEVESEVGRGTLFRALFPIAS